MSTRPAKRHLKRSGSRPAPETLTQIESRARRAGKPREKIRPAVCGPPALSGAGGGVSGARSLPQRASRRLRTELSSDAGMRCRMSPLRALTTRPTRRPRSAGAHLVDRAAAVEIVDVAVAAVAQDPPHLAAATGRCAGCQPMVVPAVAVAVRWSSRSRPAVADLDAEAQAVGVGRQRRQARRGRRGRRQSSSSRSWFCLQVEVTGIDPDVDARQSSGAAPEPKRKRLFIRGSRRRRPARAKGPAKRRPAVGSERSVDDERIARRRPARPDGCRLQRRAGRRTAPARVARRRAAGRSARPAAAAAAAEPAHAAGRRRRAWRACRIALALDLAGEDGDLQRAPDRRPD